MKAFMDKEFMLQSPTAQHLYHDYAADMPICDYHCHIPPREIYENRRFENIAQVWLGGRNPDGSYFGDHYKWRVIDVYKRQLHAGQQAHAVVSTFLAGEGDLFRGSGLLALGALGTGGALDIEVHILQLGDVYKRQGRQGGTALLGPGGK